ncbi:Cof-type HAD-IIB family hydrolase [Spiroplasma turonicum]|uniref:Nicotinic acid mononucleotide adenylyltransferase n=1 Tax=Spiroplasma turonicum TaxID=216946 RepID=A0A0K1P5T9_9MOLU|nr:Cof-type HAD-IIB family hydrolase [Spiroplasma turonicum]AKU79534.1 nicotinic acid mononucleotide adenylyltransferase [Spiroplasma turonicum]ALX70557.1 HAD family hydrolase [Spiroplasma turonicum]
MKLKETKLPYVASDLDGTIVRNEDFKILESTVIDIQEYQKLSGGKFFLITGRAYQNMKFYINQLNIELPIICSNGSAIIDPKSNEVLYEAEMNEQTVLELLDDATKHSLDVNVYTARELISLKTSERYKKYTELYSHYPKNLQPEFTFINDYNELIQEVKNKKYKALKLMYSFDPINDVAQYERLVKYLESKNLYHPQTYIQSRLIIDAMEKGTNKLSGLKMWCKIMNVNIDTIYAIGDNNNDIEMVKGCKNGISVGNGVQALKDVSKLVIDEIDNNGVGKYLKELSKVY